MCRARGIKCRARGNLSLPLFINHLGQQFGQSDSVLASRAEPSESKAGLSRHEESQAARCSRVARAEGTSRADVCHTQHLESPEDTNHLWIRARHSPWALGPVSPTTACSSTLRAVYLVRRQAGRQKAGAGRGRAAIHSGGPHPRVPGASQGSSTLSGTGVRQRGAHSAHSALSQRSIPTRPRVSAPLTSGALTSFPGTGAEFSRPCPVGEQRRGGGTGIGVLGPTSEPSSC